MSTHFENASKPAEQDEPNREVTIENTAVALKEQLSFSPYLEECALSEGLNYRTPELKEYPAVLDAVRAQIQELVFERLRLLSEVSQVPFVGQLRSPQVVDDIIRRWEEAGGIANCTFGLPSSPSKGCSFRALDCLWEIVGSKAVPFVPPKLVGEGGKGAGLDSHSVNGTRFDPSSCSASIVTTAVNRSLWAPSDTNAAHSHGGAGKGGGSNSAGFNNPTFNYRNVSAVRHILGPWDLILALAGQLPRGGLEADVATDGLAPSWTTALSPAVAARDRQCNLTQMPRSLGIHETLPGLVGLPAPSLDWLRAFFVDLRPQQRHVGLDDLSHPLFKEGRLQQGRAAVREGRIAACRRFCRFGCPAPIRASMWETCLGLRRFAEKDLFHFEALCKEALRQPLLLDLLANQDTHHARDSEHFFLFEEQVRTMLLCLLRDAEVPSHLAVPPAAAASAAMRCKHDAAVQAHRSAAVAAAVAAEKATMELRRLQEARKAADGEADGISDTGTGSSSSRALDVAAAVAAAAAIPPIPPLPPPLVVHPAYECVPFQGLAQLAAPLMYMYDHPAKAYRMFKVMYCRYWSRLFSLAPIGLPSPSLPVLLRTVDVMLEDLDPDLVRHLRRLGTPPCALTLPWISSGFVGHLAPEEVLLLWDRVLGLDSLVPLAALATAVVCFRRQVVFSCIVRQELLEAMSDISQLKVVPLLQSVLFSA